MDWVLKHPKANMRMLGYIHEFLNDEDPRPAREQFNEAYSHAGGWDPFPGFTMDTDGSALLYPGDPPVPLLAETRLRDEVIRFYNHAWVATVQPDGSYEICRMD